MFVDPQNPYIWGYNTVFNTDLHFDCKDPLVPLYGEDTVEPFQPSIELIGHYPQLLLECLEEKSFVKLYKFELTYP